ncbi:hypothetical protein PMJ10TS2_75610 [Paenibacillus melissococcoides]
MNKEEKEAFDKLLKTVEKQNKRLKELEEKRNIEPPSWAKEAAAYYANELKTKTGSYDFWRMLTIQYRKEAATSRN